MEPVIAGIAIEVAFATMALEVSKLNHTVGAVDGEHAVGLAEESHSLLKNMALDVVKGLSEHSYLNVVVQAKLKPLRNLLAELGVKPVLNEVD